MKLTLKAKKGGPRLLNRTKVIATVGPATDSLEAIEQLLVAGTDGFRLNFSHDEQRQQGQRIRWIREAARAHDRPVAIIADLQGPKLRVGVLPEPLHLQRGQKVRLGFEADYSVSGIIPTQYNLASKIKAGHRLLLNDGKISLQAKSIRRGIIEANVVQGGELSSRKGINLPDTSLGGDILTKKDLQDLDYAIKAGADYIAQSFIQHGSDIQRLRGRLERVRSHAKIIAKVETKVATEHLEEIIMAADAVMIARGDLAIETEPESVPIVQREITGLCMQYGKLSIVATQMLGSMTDSPQPSRAEVSDVASAVITGADAVMLSEETAVGKYPVEAVQMMQRIVSYTELKSPIKPLYIKLDDSSRQSAISSAATTLAHQIRAKAIVVETITGATGFSLAAHRPSIPIMMVTNNQRVAQQLAIVFGGEVFYRKSSRRAGGRIAAWLKRRGALVSGDLVVVASGQSGIIGGTDTIRVRITP